MALEIERRFLVGGDQWRRLVQRQTAIRQGYLATGEAGLTLRVRLALPPAGAMVAFLTLKLPAPGPAAAARPAGQPLTRQEYEYVIPEADGEALLAQCEHRLSKMRFVLDLPGGDWVVDVFAAANAPLVVAEVELENAAQPVAIPAWCSREITARRDLSNAALAHRPLEMWTGAEREALLP